LFIKEVSLFGKEIPLNFIEFGGKKAQKGTKNSEKMSN
jgi:hypothetical protein